MTSIQMITGGGFRRILLGSTVLGLVAGLSLLPVAYSGGGVAYAQEHSGQGRGSGAGGMGGAGQGGPGVTRGADHRSDAAPTGSGSDQGMGGQTVTRGHQGQGGSTGEETGEEGTSSDRQGPRFGGGENTRQPTPGTTGGRPVWAKEGTPEVELGRLSVARAPASVLNHAYTEVTTNWVSLGPTEMTLTADGQPTLTMTVAELYSLSATDFAHIVETYYSSITRIDSPLENLALLKNIATEGSTVLTGVTPASAIDLAAIFLGSASDKTIPVTADTVTAIYTILQLPTLTSEQTADLAEKADAVRSAIDTGHSE